MVIGFFSELGKKIGETFSPPDFHAKEHDKRAEAYFIFVKRYIKNPETQRALFQLTRMIQSSEPIVTIFSTAKHAKVHENAPELWLALVERFRGKTDIISLNSVREDTIEALRRLKEKISQAEKQGKHMDSRYMDFARQLEKDAKSFIQNPLGGLTSETPSVPQADRSAQEQQAA